MENKIYELFMKQEQVSLQKDVLPIVLTEFEFEQPNEETCLMACEFVKQCLYSVMLSGIHTVCCPVFSGDQISHSMSVVDMIWEVVHR